MSHRWLDLACNLKEILFLLDLCADHLRIILTHGVGHLLIFVRLIIDASRTLIGPILHLLIVFTWGWVWGELGCGIDIISLSIIWYDNLLLRSLNILHVHFASF